MRNQRGSAPPILFLFPILLVIMLMPNLIGGNGADEAVPPSIKPAPIVVTTTMPPALPKPEHSAKWWRELRDYAAHVHSAQVWAAWSAWVNALPQPHVTPVTYVTSVTHVTPAAQPHATEAQPRVEVVARPTGNGERTIGEGVPCDGDLTPCWRVRMESSGTWGAYNPHGCYQDGRAGCYGPYQFGWFWGGKLGLPDDLSTTTHEQWIEADRQLWANGAGCANWDAC